MGIINMTVDNYTEAVRSITCLGDVGDITIDATSDFAVSGEIPVESIDIDALWEKMYTKAKAVIIPCRYCNSHNAISNPTCVQCGAPLGERRNG